MTNPEESNFTESFDPSPQVASDLGFDLEAVRAVRRMLGEGATVPFIARYRKEATHGLDEVAIRAIQERTAYLEELEARRRTILDEIAKQGKLTRELRLEILTCTEKARLEDLYLPYKPKRRTRATIAKERGLEPLAELIWKQQGPGSPEERAAEFVDTDKGVPDADSALAGARDICAERVAERADVRALARRTVAEQGKIVVEKTKEFAEKATKFDTYDGFEQAISSIPSHRFLAIMRGETEKVLRVKLVVDEERLGDAVLRLLGVRSSGPWSAQLEKAALDALKRLVLPSVQSDVRMERKRASDEAAVEIFAKNLRELLLAPPLGPRPVIGIDPGQRTGCKVAVVDETGKLLDHTVLYLVQGDRALQQARQRLLSLVDKYHPAAIAVGNGTHGRETEAFVRDTLRERDGQQPFVVSVNEAGASVYSASDIARQEFPDLDLTVRGAVSIARRLQDPLAELVKIDPKSIGVGQYQHDVQQTLLARKLDQVVESCVNAVGVELNTASVPLLSRVAGLTKTTAKRIVSHREKKGPFASRKQLLDVPGIGPKTFEQAAGFLRIKGAEHPLDDSAVHPERYQLVEKMAQDIGVPLASLVGNDEAVKKIQWRKYVSDDVGEPTLRDILAELEKPGRDPRESFEPPAYRDDVRTLEDLQVGMQLEGVVTNVTAFGAFVDVGVHQDGLVHVSKLADRFVRDPSEVVKVGDKIRVWVLDVDLERKRISLSARSAETSGDSPSPAGSRGRRPRGPAQSNRSSGKFSNNPFAKLLRK